MDSLSRCFSTSSEGNTDMSALQLNYNTNDQNVFAHNTSEILIDGAGATLIPRALISSELLVATGRITQDADIGASLPMYAVGNAVWDAVDGYDSTDNTNGSYFSLNNDSGRDGVTPLSPTSHFNFGGTGTIRFKVRFPYSGNPTLNNYIFTTGDTTDNGGLGSLITLRHTVSGDLNLITRNDVGGGTVNSGIGSFVPVAGQEYEFELNCNGNTSVAELYIDGARHNWSISIAAQTSVSRDFFYLGNYYHVSSFPSEVSFRDLQIFNTIQHTADFTGEIPRVVNVYPFESRIVPTETVVAEGFLDLTHSATLEGTASIKYTLKIENTEYYLVGAILTVSNGTLAQSSTVAEWVAQKDAVSTFIAAGARIVFIPILASDELGIWKPTLVSTTNRYDFFALPTVCGECILYGFVKDNCSDITSGTVRVFVKKPFLTQGNLTAFDETINIELPNGFFEVPLIIPDNDDLYYILVKFVDAEGKNWTYSKQILIPNSVSALLSNVVQ